MSRLESLQARARELDALLRPGERVQVAFLDAVSVLLRGLPSVTLPLGVIAGTGWGLQQGTAAGAVLGVVVGGWVGLLPEVLLRTLVVQAYRAVLSRLDVGALQAVGGTTSVALPALASPKQGGGPMVPAPFIEPVRPPPRVGDPDADDFDD